MSNLLLAAIISIVIIGGLYLEWRGVWRRPIREMIEELKRRRRNEKAE